MTIALRTWRDRNVFVTGVTGLLGSWLTQYLVAAGANVIGLIRDSVPHSRLVREGLTQAVTLVHGEVEDYLLLERTLNEYEVDTVFHLAAQTIVGIANRNPLSTFETNIRGTWQLLEACRRTNTVKAIVVASSDKAYGSHEVLPYDEDYPLRGQHPYDVSKSCADLIALAYANTYGLPVCVTRCGNLYGGGDLNFNRLVPGTIRSVLRNEAPIIRSDGKLTRDYVYVEDAVHSYTLLSERLRADSALKGQAFNFSDENPISVEQLVTMILERMRRSDLSPVIQNKADNEIPHQFLTAAKARRLLDWRPRYSLIEGLDKTIAWYQAFLGDSSQLSLDRKMRL